MSVGFFESVQHRLKDYGSQTGQVQRWHELRALNTQCIEFELLLRHGLSLLNQVNEADEKWRSAVLRGDAPYNSDFEVRLTGFYDGWIKPCESLIGELTRLEFIGFEIDRATEFREACRNVEGILTEDSDFFSGDALTELRDRAIDEYRAGRCGPA